MPAGSGAPCQPAYTLHPVGSSLSAERQVLSCPWVGGEAAGPGGQTQRRTGCSCAGLRVSGTPAAGEAGASRRREQARGPLRWPRLQAGGGAAGLWARTAGGSGRPGGRPQSREGLPCQRPAHAGSAELMGLNTPAPNLGALPPQASASASCCAGGETEAVCREDILQGHSPAKAARRPLRRRESWAALDSPGIPLPSPAASGGWAATGTPVVGCKGRWSARAACPCLTLGAREAVAPVQPREHAHSDPAHSGAARGAQGGFSRGWVGASPAHQSVGVHVQCGSAESGPVHPNLRPLRSLGWSWAAPGWEHGGPHGHEQASRFLLRWGLPEPSKACPQPPASPATPHPIPGPGHSPCSVPTLPSALPALRPALAAWTPGVS